MLRVRILVPVLLAPAFVAFLTGHAATTVPATAPTTARTPAPAPAPVEGGRTEGKLLVAGSRRLPKLPAWYNYPVEAAPDGRRLLLHEEVIGDFPGSDWDQVVLADLQGKRKVLASGFSTSSAFVQGGKGVVYWVHEKWEPTGRLAYLAPGAKKPRVLIRLREEGGSAYWDGLAWSDRAGMLLTLHQPEKGSSEVIGISLPRGSRRTLARFTGVKLKEPLWAPDGKRFLLGVSEPGTGTIPFPPTFLRVLDRYGKPVRELGGGEPLGWLADGRTIIVGREGSLPLSPYHYGFRALFRVDVTTGARKLLAEVPKDTRVRLSPSSRWLGAAGEGGMWVVDTRNGDRLRLPRNGVSHFLWGRTDEELLVRTDQEWRLLRLRLLPGSRPAAPPPPEQVKVAASKPHPLRWQPRALSPTNTFQGPAALRSVTFVGDELWLGTDAGLRVADDRGREKLLQPWQAALSGLGIEGVVLKGDTAWIGARRRLPDTPGFAGQDRPRVNYQLLLLRADRRSGVVEEAEVMLPGVNPTGERALPAFIPRQNGGFAIAGPWMGSFFWDAESKAVRELGGRNSYTPVAGTTAVTGGDGELWIGGQGLRRWRPGEPELRRWTERDGLTADTVYSLCREGERLWIGTAAGLDVMDTRTGTIRSVRASGAGTEAVEQLLEADGSLYGRTASALLVRDGPTGPWSREALPPGGPVRLFTDGQKLYGTAGASGELRVRRGPGWWTVVVRGRPTGVGR